MDLEARFIDFLRSLSGAEFIDDFSPDIFDGEKRADFLLDFRRVVLELKTLKQDPSYKVAEHLKQYVNLPEFPIFLWNANIDDVVSPLSNGHEIKRKIFDALTRTIQTSVEKADDQIESTKKRLGLTNSSGILSILNEGVAILTPDVIAKRVSEILHNRFKGKVRYGNISHVLLISESHIVNTGGQQFTGSLITVEGPTARANVEAGNYLELLSEKWGQYCSAPIYFSPNHSFAGMEFEDWVRTKGNSSPGHHSWVQEYWRRPYLDICRTTNLSPLPLACSNRFVLPFLTIAKSRL